MTRIVVYELLSAGALPLAPADARLLTQGRTMRDALVDALSGLPGLQVSVVASQAAPATGGRALAVPPGEPPEATLRRLALGHELVWAVAPESESWLIRCQAAVGDARWVGSTARALAVTSHKSRTLQALQAAGLATPLSAAADSAPGHWVVKPDQGAGAEGVWRLADARQARRLAEARQARGEAVLLQPWIDGEPLSLGLACGPAGARLLSVNRQQLSVPEDGELRYLGVQVDVMGPADPRWPLLERVGRGVAAAIPGLRGHVGVDLVWHPQWGPVCIEVNARPTCALAGLLARQGAPLAAQLLAPWWQPTGTPRDVPMGEPGHV